MAAAVTPPSPGDEREPPTAHRRGRWVLLFVGAMVLVAVPGLVPLRQHGWDPTALLRVGTFAASRPFVEQDLPDPVLVGDYGHDGQQFYVLAESLPDLAGAADDVDDLGYRARRILLPLVVSPLPAGEATIWGFLAVNLLAVGAAAVGIGRLAQRLDLSPWLGLSVAATPALYESVQGSLADAPAFALAVWAVVVCRRRPWLAAGLLLLAGLTRETTLVVAVACAVVAPRHRRLILLSPLAGYAVWAAVVSQWLPGPTGRSSRGFADQLLAQIDWPFLGWADSGITGPGALTGASLVLLGLGSAWVLRHPLPELSLWLLADVVILVLVDAGVVERPQNLARVAPLVVAATVLAVASVLRDRARIPIAGAATVGDATP